MIRGAARLGVLVTGLLVAALVVQPGAHAVPRTLDGAGGVAVTLHSQAPSAPQVGDTLTITGTVTNRTGVDVAHAQVRLRVSPTPVRSRAEIPQILSGEAGRSGVSVAGTLTPVADTLAPDASGTFRIAVPVDALGLGTAPAVVVLGVESIGDVADDGLGPVQTGFTRTFLPWFPAGSPVAPTHVVWLFPLTTAPAREADGVFLDDHLAAEIGPRGRLTALLTTAAAAPTSVSWVVDPALIESLTAMAKGYDVRKPGGGTTVGTGSAAATAWLARLRELTVGGEVTATAYGLPDVVALHRAGLDVDIALTATTASGLVATALGRPAGHGLAWPAAGLADDGTLDVLRASGARVVVLSSAALPPETELTYTPSGSVDLVTGSSPLRAAVFDDVISRAVAAPVRTATEAPAPDPIVRRQTAVALIAMTTLELPSTSRTLVLAPDPLWRPDTSVARDLVASLTSPWSTPSSLETLVHEPASDVPRRHADYPDAAAALELSPAFLDVVSRQRAALAGLRAVAPDVPGMSTSGLESALSRAESAAWRQDPATGRHLLTFVTAAIAGQVGQVTVLSRAPVTLPGDSGIIPVTVSNALDRPARVGVRLTGTPALRFEAADVPPVTLAPGEKATLEVQARVIGTGPVAVDIALLTPDGTAFGDPVRTEVRSAAYARAAAWVVGGLFGVLIVLLGVGLVRRIASRGGQAPVPAEDAPDSADDEGATS